MMLKTLIELKVTGEKVLYSMTVGCFYCQQASILVLRSMLQRNQIPGQGSVQHVALPFKHMRKALPTYSSYLHMCTRKPVECGYKL